MLYPWAIGSIQVSGDEMPMIGTLPTLCCALIMIIEKARVLSADLHGVSLFSIFAKRCLCCKLQCYNFITTSCSTSICNARCMYLHTSSSSQATRHVLQPTDAFSKGTLSFSFRSAAWKQLLQVHWWGPKAVWCRASFPSPSMTSHVLGNWRYMHIKSGCYAGIIKETQHLLVKSFFQGRNFIPIITVSQHFSE